MEFDLSDSLFDRFELEGSSPDEHSVQQHSERVDIDSRGTDPFPLDQLLRGHVLRGTLQLQCRGFRIAIVEQLRQSKIGDLGGIRKLGIARMWVLEQEHVTGLQVAVDDPLLVAIVDGAGKRPDDLRR